MTDRRRLLLVHAHPDDETITTGGTIARYGTDGAEVFLVTCTLGEEGEIIPPELEQLGAWAGDQLGGYRSGELATVCALLGVSGHRYLGGIGRWRDSGPPSLGRAGQPAGTPAAEHPRAFVRGELGKQAAQLAELIDELQPQVVVSYDAFGGYGHPDHIRAHEITMAAAPEASSVVRVFHAIAPESAVHRGLDELRAARADIPFRVPEPGELPTVPDSRVTTAIDIGAHRERKFAALRAHATQISVSSGPPACFALSNGIAQPHLGTEYFELVHGPAAGCEHDLFGGLS